MTTLSAVLSFSQPLHWLPDIFVFTGIAVSVLNSSAPDSAKIIQGTIAAAAVINEIIAVIAAKKVLNGQEKLTDKKFAYI